jgi:uncharacterized damage-inducible protein DinB
MKGTLLMYARYTERVDAKMIAFLDKLSAEEREKDRKSYYGSLSGLARHVLDGATYFHGLFRASMPSAAKALEPTLGMKVPEGRLDAKGWESAKASLAAADRATIALLESLSDQELASPVAVDWYGGKPPSVPFHFLAHQLVVHGLHHRGQVSQILDEMGVEHDYSGIDLDLAAS